MMGPFKDGSSADRVALVLAVGISIALNIMVCAAILVAWLSHSPIGENATQILASWGGGMLGVLGAFVGYAFGKQQDPSKPPPPPKAPPAPQQPGQRP